MKGLEADLIILTEEMKQYTGITNFNLKYDDKCDLTNVNLTTLKNEKHILITTKDRCYINE